MTEQTTQTQTVVSTLTIADNHDTGSLRITEPGFSKPSVGISILVSGESKPRTVTYIMGSEKKGFFACCKGSGPFPLGTVTVSILGE